MEHFRLLETEAGWALEGTLVLRHPRGPFGASYSVLADSRWRTRAVAVRCVGSERERTVRAESDGKGNWTEEGTVLPALKGCLDADLGFTPSTNTLPIRRLGLPVGGSAPVEAAWLRFPELTWERLPQTYTRVSDSAWEYRSPGFRLTLDVDDLGIVRLYPDYWRQAAPAV
jgi:hypothetical protein